MYYVITINVFSIIFYCICFLSKHLPVYFPSFEVNQKHEFPASGKKLITMVDVVNLFLICISVNKN